MRSSVAVAASARFARLDAVEQQRQLDVFDGGEHGHQVPVLEDEAHHLGTQVALFLVVQVVHGLAADEHAAAVDAVEARQAVEQRRLARARRAGDRDELALVHDEADAVDAHDVVGLGDVVLDDAFGVQDRFTRTRGALAVGIHCSLEPGAAAGTGATGTGCS